MQHSTAPKKTQQEQKKYHPTFQKPDYEAIAQENIQLKQDLHAEKDNVASLKFRLGEAERKIKFLEGMQEKLSRAIEQSDGKAHIEQKQQPVYTEILKKKIQELNDSNVGLQEQIQQLKHLPHVSVFDEANVEKEYLMRETIRLRSIIASNHTNNHDCDFDNKFLRLMKEENEKLKATVRQYENDKNLLKSRQSIQKRQIQELKKECDQLKQKLTQKEA